MLNINRNMRLLDNLQMQFATGKRIQFPSDNPIVASRALSFRTTVAQNLQHQRNVDQAESWMEVTESGFFEVSSVLTRINELVVQGDALENVSGMRDIATQISTLMDQLGLAMNQSYTGRYLFSGFRTDQPGVLLRDDPTLRFNDITQRFTQRNVEQISAFQRFGPGERPEVTEASVLKLPYTFAENVRVTIDASEFTQDQIDAMEDDHPLVDNPVTTPAALATALAGASEGDIIRFTYAGTDQIIIFASQRTANGPNADQDTFRPGEFEIFHSQDTGQLVLGSAFAGANTFDVQYDKEGFSKGDLNPIVYFTATSGPNGNPPNRTFTMDGHQIEFEFGVGTRFAVNSLAKDVLPAHLVADLRSFAGTVLNIELAERTQILAALRANPAHQPPNDVPSEEDFGKMADEQMANEQQWAMTTIQSKFSNMIGLLEGHSSTLSRHQTDLGARMNRLDLTRERLERDEITFELILSQNEDVDLAEVAMRLRSAESVYQASLQAGINMVQLSLANFL